jgi:hypothetical protein
MEQDWHSHQTDSPPAYLSDRHLPAPIRTSRNGPALPQAPAPQAAARAPSLFGQGSGSSSGPALLTLAPPPHKPSYLSELAAGYGATYRWLSARAACSWPAAAARHPGARCALLQHAPPHKSLA